jgi:hypothetical protein
MRLSAAVGVGATFGERIDASGVYPSGAACAALAAVSGGVS